MSVLEFGKAPLCGGGGDGGLLLSRADLIVQKSRCSSLMPPINLGMIFVYPPLGGLLTPFLFRLIVFTYGVLSCCWPLYDSELIMH